MQKITSVSLSPPPSQISEVRSTGVPICDSPLTKHLWNSPKVYFRNPVKRIRSKFYVRRWKCNVNTTTFLRIFFHLDIIIHNCHWKAPLTTEIDILQLSCRANPTRCYIRGCTLSGVKGVNHADCKTSLYCQAILPCNWVAKQIWNGIGSYKGRCQGRRLIRHARYIFTLKVGVGGRRGFADVFMMQSLVQIW